jgi:peptidoglycan hydrolase CwlO-like protein
VIAIVDILLVVIALLTNGSMMLMVLRYVQRDNMTIGELVSKLHASELQVGTANNELQKREFRIYELEAAIAEQQLNSLEQKEQIRSQRNIINRADGRISVYEENERTFTNELARLRNQVQAEHAKFKFLERENAELRYELRRVRHPEPNVLTTG